MRISNAFLVVLAGLIVGPAAAGDIDFNPRPRQNAADAFSSGMQNGIGMGLAIRQQQMEEERLEAEKAALRSALRPSGPSDEIGWTPHNGRDVAEVCLELLGNDAVKAMPDKSYTELVAVCIDAHRYRFGE